MATFLLLSHPHVELSISLLVLVVFAPLLPCCYCVENDDPSYTLCKQNFDCGLMQNLSYPFWSVQNRSKICGGNYGFELICEADRYPIGKLPGLESIRLFYVNQSAKVMSWISEDFWNLALCPGNFANESAVKGPFRDEYNEAPEGSVFLRLYSGCDRNNTEVPNFDRFPCPIRGEEGSDAFYSQEFGDACNFRGGGFWIPKAAIYLSDNYGEFENSVCPLCEASLGICGTDKSTNGFACLCRDGPRDYLCETNGVGRLYSTPQNTFNLNFRISEAPYAAAEAPYEPWITDEGSASDMTTILIIIGVTCGVAITIFCIILILCYLRKKASSVSDTNATESNQHTNATESNQHTNATESNQHMHATESNRNVESFLRNHGALILKRYSFSDVNTMTDSFKHLLGQGGYGSVYKGELRNGCLVAVKVLNISKGNGEEFINEVASISRTSHVNIVNLLGFCVEGHKRILIYEFMPNGSLDKFIGSKASVAEQLGWENLYQIALGVARGLEYLHRGCNTRIVHLDIKPHNILLDRDLCPKISDFGLAKLVYKQESAVSLAEARGTIGYIAPEVFMKHLGRVSYKSDIYSFGMMILEMVGARNNAPEEVENSTDKYFPNWIYTQLEASETFGLVAIEEEEVLRKMTIVGLWCIQTNPSDRPSTNKVIEMLEGSVEALQIPERPSWTSPSRVPSDSFTLSMN